MWRERRLPTHGVQPEPAILNSTRLSAAGVGRGGAEGKAAGGEVGRGGEGRRLRIRVSSSYFSDVKGPRPRGNIVDT